MLFYGILGDVVNRNFYIIISGQVEILIKDSYFAVDKVAYNIQKAKDKHWSKIKKKLNSLLFNKTESIMVFYKLLNDNKKKDLNKNHSKSFHSLKTKFHLTGIL